MATVAEGNTTTGAPTTIATTSAVAEGAWNGIELRADGIGIADYGQPAQQVIDTVGAVLGDPDYDSGDEVDTGCVGTHRIVRFAVPAPENGVASQLVLHFNDDTFAEMLFTDWAYWRAGTDGAATAKGMLSTAEGITLGSTTDEAIAAYGFAFGYNALSGDVMGWTDDGAIVYADFGNVMVDMATDLSQLHGDVSGIRYPLEACPDELSY